MLRGSLIGPEEYGLIKTSASVSGCSPPLSLCDSLFSSLCVWAIISLVFEETRSVLFPKHQMKGFGLRPRIPAASVNCWMTVEMEGSHFCKSATFPSQKAECSAALERETEDMNEEEMIESRLRALTKESGS
ncbi:hypothetical protein JOB18_006381 [Solea senegalensis]|uniref:Uncharacterized protein n=1 Tax=Solea senegalensis TaxID=28829 RepID=A0AAV6SY91_SOLSE|nr:hypothetical protein JOB18_006381 [Solea senegalensis]